MTNDNHDLINSLDNLPAEATRRGEDNESRVGHALQRHGNSVLPALFNPGEHRLVREHLAAELSLGFEHRRAALTMALETRLQSVREACNHVLVTGKTHLRQQRLEYFGEVYRQVESRMNRLADDYITDSDRRFSRLDAIKSEQLRRREEQRLEKSADDFMTTLDQLMNEFRSIIQENVDTRGEPGMRG